MIAIWKFPLRPPGEMTVLEMPKGAAVLTAQMQGATGHIWAEVTDTKGVLKVIRRFIVIGTGWNLDQLPERKYIGTMQSEGFVWHVYEVLN